MEALVAELTTVVEPAAGVVATTRVLTARERLLDV